MVQKAREAGERITVTKLHKKSRDTSSSPVSPSQGKPSAMVTVMKGCNKNCAFCIVPRVRGRAIKPCDEVVAEVGRCVRPASKR